MQQANPVVPVSDLVARGAIESAVDLATRLVRAGQVDAAEMCGALADAVGKTMAPPVARRLALTLSAAASLAEGSASVTYEQLAERLGCPSGALDGACLPDRGLERDMPLPDRYRKDHTVISTGFAFRYDHHDFRLVNTYFERLGPRVLHLGCNVGVNSIILARGGRQVHGVDLNAAALRGACGRRAGEPARVAGRVSFQLAQFSEMVVPDRFFDAAIAFDVLEHVYADELPVVLAAVARSLKPGGLFLIHTPHERSFADESHVNVFTPESLADFVRPHFAVERCYVTTEADGVNRRINVVASAPVPGKATGLGRVLTVGPDAEAAFRALAGVASAVGSVVVPGDAPPEGTAASWQELLGYDFDTALVAGGERFEPLARRIERELAARVIGPAGIDSGVVAAIETRCCGA